MFIDNTNIAISTTPYQSESVFLEMLDFFERLDREVHREFIKEMYDELLSCTGVIEGD